MGERPKSINRNIQIMLGYNTNVTYISRSRGEAKRQARMFKHYQIHFKCHQTIPDFIIINVFHKIL